MLNKKAAMFGLDARIALAIFGALSVITGAALYSAIKDSKAVSVLASMEEVSKALEALYLDTGVYPNNSATANQLKATDLIKDNGVTGWNGPYLAYSEKIADLTLDGGDYGHITVYKMRNTTWATLAEADVSCRTTDKSCGLWLQFQDVEADILKAIETKVDGTKTPGDDDFSGRFRYASSIKDGGLFVLIKNN